MLSVCHGTTREAAEKIVREGFNTDLVWVTSSPEISFAFGDGETTVRLVVPAELYREHPQPNGPWAKIPAALIDQFRGTARMFSREELRAELVEQLRSVRDRERTAGGDA